MCCTYSAACIAGQTLYGHQLAADAFLSSQLVAPRYLQLSSLPCLTRRASSPIDAASSGPLAGLPPTSAETPNNNQVSHARNLVAFPTRVALVVFDRQSWAGLSAFSKPSVGLEAPLRCVCFRIQTTIVELMQCAAPLAHSEVSVFVPTAIIHLFGEKQGVRKKTQS